MSRAKPANMQSSLITRAVREAFIKLDPRLMWNKPVMLVAELGCVLTLLLVFAPGLLGGDSARGYNAAVFLIVLVTLLFGNFAEAIAEGRGRAQLDSLKKTRRDTQATLLLADGSTRRVSATELRKGDLVIVAGGELIPSDGEIVEGVASIDESAITGESAPVIKESGSDFSSVTGGTRVISDQICDRITVRISSDPGEAFFDRMINLVEGAKRQKTPNEVAVETLLVGLTLIFVIACLTLVPIASYVDVAIPAASLVALLVCLIPTTIGGLLSTIRIAGMDRVTQFNVIAASGKAVEAAGDIHTIILDKTGTITHGNRMAVQFIPVGECDLKLLDRAAAFSSIYDETPEGRSVVELARKLGVAHIELQVEGSCGIEFTAETRMSGTDFADGTEVRKGAVDAVKDYVVQRGGVIPADLDEKAAAIAAEGGTPLAVAKGGCLLGLIYLKDTVKAGMRDRFDELRQMGIRTIMCTGDNPLTAATIAREAGVDEFIAEAKPEDKLALIRREQAAGKLVAMTGDGTNDAPALAQADVGLAMNCGTMAAKEAANMVDLDSDPTKIIELVAIGKQLLMTRGALTIFSLANDIAKCFAIIPALVTLAIPQMQAFNLMHLATPHSAILSALIFNAVTIPLFIPLALRGIPYVPMSSAKLLRRNLLIYGLGGLIAPFIGIKAIDIVLSLFRLV